MIPAATQTLGCAAPPLLPHTRSNLLWTQIDARFLRFMGTELPDVFCYHIQSAQTAVSYGSLQRSTILSEPTLEDNDPSTVLTPAPTQHNVTSVDPNATTSSERRYTL